MAYRCDMVPWITDDILMHYARFVTNPDEEFRDTEITTDSGQSFNTVIIRDHIGDCSRCRNAYWGELVIDHELINQLLEQDRTPETLKRAEKIRRELRTIGSPS
jgi:hypothetical protein